MNSCWIMHDSWIMRTAVVEAKTILCKHVIMPKREKKNKPKRTVYRKWRIYSIRLMWMRFHSLGPIEKKTDWRPSPIQTFKWPFAKHEHTFLNILVKRRVGTKTIKMILKSPLFGETVNLWLNLLVLFPCFPCIRSIFKWHFRIKGIWFDILSLRAHLYGVKIHIYDGRTNGRTTLCPFDTFTLDG